MDRLRREVRVFMDGYLDLQRQSDQLTEAVSQRDRVARDLRARIDNLTAENSALRESERNLQNTVHQRQTTVDERNRTIAQQGGTIAGYESTIQERDRTLQERDRTLQERDRTIARQREDIARQERVAQDQDIRIRDLETRVTALQQNFQTQINQLKNVENMSFIDAMKLAGAPLFGRRQVIIRHIMNERR
jgi:chromosome segregation ATPase